MPRPNLFTVQVVLIILLFASCRLAPTVVLAQERVSLPAASTVVWQTDWEIARRKAVEENKPLFVRFRCAHMPPDLAALDAQIERPAKGSALEKLLREKYVPVQIGSVKGVSLNTFRFDYDLQLAGLVLDGRDSTTIARWGTRDAQSATSRLSVTGLSRVLEQAAKVYAARTPNASNAAEVAALPPDAHRLDRLYPAFAFSKRMEEPCWHCHYVYDADVSEAKAMGGITALRKKLLLFKYPLPESIGLSLSKNAETVVSVVRPGSPAEKGGVHVGDTIVRADEQAVYSSADFQTVLNYIVVNDISRSHVILSEPLLLELRRESSKAVLRATVELAPGWFEAEDVSWRPSQGAVPPILGTWETPLSKAERKAARLPEMGSLALRVSFVFAGKKWAASHGDLRVGDVIVAVNGQSPPLDSARQFHTWYRLHTEVGQTAKFTVLRNRKRLIVSVSCVDVSL